MSDQVRVDALPPVVPAVVAQAPSPEPGPTPATRRFHGCRWHKPAETGVPAHCGHRDVLPMAGAGGFSADAWCADCPHYKPRRLARRTTY